MAKIVSPPDPPVETAAGAKSKQWYGNAAVRQRCGGISNATFYRWQKRKLFPRGKKVGGRRRMWDDDMIAEGQARVAGERD